jgi:hypothetical protein
MVDLAEKILVGRVLIDILDEQTVKLDDPYDDELPMFIHKAMIVRLKMKQWHSTHGQPPEMVDQLEQMDKIIKRLMELQNKKCC